MAYGNSEYITASIAHNESGDVAACGSSGSEEPAMETSMWWNSLYPQLDSMQADGRPLASVKAEQVDVSSGPLHWTI
eukprot:scaffold172784_cov24-Cyclotella_meneghiniana.AAC.2